MVNENFEKSTNITFFVYDEGNLDHGIVYMNGDRVDWTVNEWKKCFTAYKKITYYHDKKYKQNESVPGKKVLKQNTQIFYDTKKCSQ